MGNYVVLARKWRPSQFSDIVGQTPVVRTLMNAIQSQRLHHAYVFAGSRGIGKTSIARIFAKNIRCENTETKNNWLESCDTCSSCLEIKNSTSVDVNEIDGASNNGVEAIREIRENAKYLPASGSKKIYIIDEVHMLTTAAFNALLKTLEEPPAHVIFIFATTEAHKIPATILSRCQRFDFRRVTIPQIQQRLVQITAAEKIQAEPTALAALARSADGSMRDALSLLDQTIAFSGATVTLDAVRESIGLIQSESVLRILKTVFERSPQDAVKEVQRIYEEGHDLRLLTRTLLEYLHACMLAQVGVSTNEMLSSEDWEEVKKLAPLRSIEQTELIFQVLQQGLESIARSPQPKITLDVLLIKCAAAETLMPLEVSNNTQSNIQTPQAISENISTPEIKPERKSEKPSIAQNTAFSWDGFISHVSKARPFLASLLEHAGTVELPNKEAAKLELIVRFHPNDHFKYEQLQTRTYQQQLQTLADQYFGGKTSVVAEIKETVGKSLAELKKAEVKQKEENARERIRQHPLIVEAQSLFGGDLRELDMGGQA